MKTPVLLFDVNETLLDMRALDPLFEEAFGTPPVRQEWFLTLQGLWMTCTLTNRFVPFDKLVRAALDMTARRHVVSLDAPVREAILESLRHLPPYPTPQRRWTPCDARASSLRHSPTAPRPAFAPSCGTHDYSRNSTT